MSNALEARRFLRAHRAGTLSTLSQKYGGYPFGSVVSYATDHAACPVILVSGLAEHTRNIGADPRVSLLAQDPNAGDVQSSARLTVLGEAARADDVAARRRYLALFPESEELLGLGDFGFWRIVPKAVRFIGGFGRIHWVDPAQFAPPPNGVGEIDTDILSHMNADHANAIAAYCRNAFGFSTDEARMVAVDCDGFDVRSGDHLLRFDFPAPVSDAAEARAALVAMARENRS